jgi:Recombinase
LAAIKANADRRALKLARTIAAIRANGAMSLKEVADELNRQRISSARGGQWYSSTVRDLEARVQRQTGKSNPFI